jgi:hypothetical protein
MKQSHKKLKLHSFHFEYKELVGERKKKKKNKNPFDFNLKDTHTYTPKKTKPLISFHISKGNITEIQKGLENFKSNLRILVRDHTRLLLILILILVFVVVVVVAASWWSQVGFSCYCCCGFGVVVVVVV